MSYEALGKLIVKGEIETKGQSFQVRELVIEIAGTYPQMVKYQLTQDRCSQLDTHNVGDIIKVHFDLRGREYNGKYYTNLNCWRIEKVQQQQQPTQTAPLPPKPQSTPVLSGDSAPQAGDDLPF